MTKSIIMICTAVLVNVACAQKSSLKGATVRFRVVDDVGNPVTNAWMRGFSVSTIGGKPGNTDTNGVFSYYDRQVYSPIGCVVLKEGYYQTKGAAWQWKNWGEVPTNTLPVVLKRIINPVPMVKRSITAWLPKLNVPVAFDLEKGDWVSPLGRGNREDIWLVGTRRYVTRKDHDITIKLAFSNSLDGIQVFWAPPPNMAGDIASDLPPPAVAPENNYTKELLLWQSWHPNEPMRGHVMANLNYIFRVRSKLDGKGDLQETNYGWIKGNIQIDTEESESIYLSFEYYYNPDPLSRSLEPKEIADLQKIWLRNVEKRQK